jgi:hypothetical protein
VLLPPASESAFCLNLHLMCKPHAKNLNAVTGMQLCMLQHTKATAGHHCRSQPQNNSDKHLPLTNGATQASKFDMVPFFASGVAKSCNHWLLAGMFACHVSDTQDFLPRLMHGMQPRHGIGANGSVIYVVDSSSQGTVRGAVGSVWAALLLRVAQLHACCRARPCMLSR